MRGRLVTSSLIGVPFCLCLCISARATWTLFLLEEFADTFMACLCAACCWSVCLWALIYMRPPCHLVNSLTRLSFLCPDRGFIFSTLWFNILVIVSLCSSAHSVGGGDTTVPFRLFLEEFTDWCLHVYVEYYVSATWCWSVCLNCRCSFVDNQENHCYSLSLEMNYLGILWWLCL